MDTVCSAKQASVWATTDVWNSTRAIRQEATKRISVLMLVITIDNDRRQCYENHGRGMVRFSVPRTWHLHRHSCTTQLWLMSTATCIVCPSYGLGLEDDMGVQNRRCSPTPGVNWLAIEGTSTGASSSFAVDAMPRAFRRSSLNCEIPNELIRGRHAA